MTREIQKSQDHTSKVCQDEIGLEENSMNALVLKTRNVMSGGYSLT